MDKLDNWGLPFLFYIFKGDLKMKVYARFDEILTVGYF